MISKRLTFAYGATGAIGSTGHGVGVQDGGGEHVGAGVGVQLGFGEQLVRRR